MHSKGLSILLACLSTIFVDLQFINPVNGQIPYTYSRGRDLAAVNRRFNAFLSAINRGGSAEELQNICGPLRLNPNSPVCTTKVGRPTDAEIESCDVYCCLAGHKTGNCKRNGPGIQVDASTVAEIIGKGSSGSSSDILTAIPSLIKLSVSCKCLNDDKDVRCGLDGSFLGVRCPDNSACWRKCCREGRSGGRCRGFLKLSCRCHD